jgi:Sensors of blue-light using FAD
MAMIQLIYASQPFGFDEAALNSILTSARHFNTRDEITGALICREDVYLQMLEGPEDKVEAAYGRITRDSRHLEINRLSSAPITERMFPTWAMRDDPARSWMWTRAEVADGAVANATRDELLGVFARLAKEPAAPVFA